MYSRKRTPKSYKISSGPATSSAVTRMRCSAVEASSMPIACTMWGPTLRFIARIAFSR